MQMSIKNFYAYRSRENNSNKLLANDSNFAAGAVCAGAVCAGACVQVRVIFAATLHQRSNFTAALHLLCGNLATSRQPTGRLRSTGSIEVNGVSPRLCDIIRLYILSGSHPCGRRRRFISQIRFVARNNDSSTSNLGFGTMNARTFFFFFSTTGNLRRHNAIFLSGDNKLYIIISAASALSFCLAAIDASLDPPSTCSDRDIDTALIDVERTDWTANLRTLPTDNALDNMASAN